MRHKTLRIAQVAPLFESVPPHTYGGTERIVSYLTEELISLGHQVTLFAAGDSVTKAAWCQFPIDRYANTLRRLTRLSIIRFSSTRC